MMISYKRFVHAVDGRGMHPRASTPYSLRRLRKPKKHRTSSGVPPAMCPARIAPQLLASAKAAPEGDGWLHEIKYDGYRLLCRLEHGRARLFSRPGRDWTAELPMLVAAVEGLGIGSAWLDGE